MENSTSEKEGLETLRVDAENAAEWIKSAAVSPDQARRSLDRLDTLERNKPTTGQVARYGGIGALGGATAGAVGNVIETGAALKGATPKAKLLNLASSAAKGAIGGGALPLLRSHSDRRAEMGTLRNFMNQDKVAALGAAPLWRQQAGFTPPGMMTAAQRLKKSMSMGVVDPNKGLKPLNIKVGSTLVEIAKQAGLVGNMVQKVPQAIHAAPAMAKNLMTAPTEHFGHLNEVAGLGVLALPGLDTLQAKARARLAGDRSEHGAEKRQLMGEGAHAALDVGGLGMLAAPALAKLKHAFASSAYGGNTAQNGPGMKAHSQLPPFKVPPIEVKTSSFIHDRLKEAGVGVGAGMTTSQYSGPLSFGPFKMTSGIPPFRRPNMTKHDESLEGAAWQTGGNKEAAALLQGFEAGLKEASTAGTGAMGAAGKLSTSQRVGAPKTTGFAGPSIADVAKPKGFGMPMPGAQKNQI